MRSDAYRRFTAKLLQARKLRKLTQQQVAAHLGWPQSMISEMENNQRRVDVIELAAMAKLYGKPLKYFIPDEE